MAEVFPVTLQDKFNQAGFNTNFGETTITSNMETSLPKKRARHTKSIDTTSGTINLHKDDWTTLETFYKTTLGGGVLTFNFTHPITQVITEYRFVTPPTATPLGGLYFIVNFNWVEIP